MWRLVGFSTIIISLAVGILLNARTVSAAAASVNFNSNIKEAFGCGAADLEARFIDPKVKKISRTENIFEAVWDIKVPIDFTILGIIDIAIWGNGGWKENFLKQEQENVIGWFQKTFPELSKVVPHSIGLEDYPIPEGRYNVSIPVNDILVEDFPKVPAGLYKTTIDLLKDGRIISCFGLVVEITPKTKRNRKKKPSK